MAKTSNSTPYPYDDLLNEVKGHIMPTLIPRVSETDAKNLGLSIDALGEIRYTQIMALGYNNENINASLEDLMPSRSPIVYNSGNAETDAANMALHLIQVLKDFQHQVWAFNSFHEDTQNQLPPDKVMINVKKHLLYA